MKIMRQIQERRYYTGKPLETGGTSIAGNEAPGVRFLFQKGYFDSSYTILDYGAGKFARNADYLREKGMKVYAYDPFNGKPGADGWEIGKVSLNLPNIKFDIAFTSFVLNVVPFHIEEDILKDVRKYSGNEYHITRNKDIFVTIKSALLRKDPIVYNFYINEYGGSPDIENITDEEIMDFCYFGVQTSRGFQRIPLLEEERGYKLIKNTSAFKVYTD